MGTLISRYVPRFLGKLIKCTYNVSGYKIEISFPLFIHFFLNNLVSSNRPSAKFWVDRIPAPLKRDIEQIDGFIFRDEGIGKCCQHGGVQTPREQDGYLGMTTAVLATPIFRESFQNALPTIWREFLQSNAQ